MTVEKNIQPRKSPLFLLGLFAILGMGGMSSCSSDSASSEGLPKGKTVNEAPRDRSGIPRPQLASSPKIPVYDLGEVAVIQPTAEQMEAYRKSLAPPKPKATRKTTPSQENENSSDSHSHLSLPQLGVSGETFSAEEVKHLPKVHTFPLGQIPSN